MAYDKQYYEANKLKLRASTQKYLNANPQRYLWSALNARCKNLSIEMDIVPEDLEIPETCPYLGIPLSYLNPSITNGSMSVDRIDNTKGYLKGNVEVISHLANRMKNNATKEQLITFAKAILAKYDT